MKRHHDIKKSEIKNVPFIDQDDYLCAPASLGMVLQYKGKDVSREELRKKLVTEKSKGTFQTNLLSEVRYQGMMGLPVESMEDLLKEIESGNPVIVFQNLGLSMAPIWHYSVVTGFNLGRKVPMIRMHSGHDQHKKIPMKEFEETWTMADSWGLIVLNPGEISRTQNELAHIRAAAGLERVNKIEEAEASYQSILKKWPGSLAALIGMGNVAYTQKNYRDALFYLEKAVSTHPDSAIAWHNLATLEGILGKVKKARLSAANAMRFAKNEEAATYEKSLKRWLQ